MSAAFSPAFVTSDEHTASQQAMLRDLLHSDTPLSDDDRTQILRMLGGTPAASATASSPSSEKRSRSEQSRINGAKSRGPVTAFGKQLASMNAIIHGLRSRPGLLPDEDPAAFDTFIADVIAELSPATALQHQLARRVAELSWRLSRVPAIEADLLRRMADDTGVPLMGDRGVDALLSEAIGVEKDNALLRIQRYATSIERSMRTSLGELRQLQSVAAAAIASSKAGAVGATTRAAAETTGDAAAQPPPAARQDQPAAFDGLRISGSFGAAATMAMPVTAINEAANPAAHFAEAAATAISGSFGKKASNAGKARPAMSSTNDILPRLAVAHPVSAAL